MIFLKLICLKVVEEGDPSTESQPSQCGQNQDAPPRTEGFYKSSLTDFAFAFNDSNFSDRVIRIEIASDSLETRPESQACHTLTDWERKSKRHRGDVAKNENNKRALNSQHSAVSSKSRPREKYFRKRTAVVGKKRSDGDEKLYKGLHGYTDYRAGFRREHAIASEKAGLLPTLEFQPDICKDYKETGYCGYGDSCKFMHDRGNYKSGWQLENEWNEREKARKKALALGTKDDDEMSDEHDDDSLPFARFLCREPFADPVETKCKYYFCEHCALKHHAKSKRCFVCNQPTNGIFNTAFELCKKMAERKRWV
ncbi:zinc finger CCCH domain-containing 1 [Olea europaea subsp. europaea]|uniref:Zinc finger CCCH domain-containing 1 n=1 Tax=Olea europaea subsp. europaea TaxID=158383 RepID=A0A8S0QSF8_OLEEU|nr:zinc finger CCCH domain-containing 1 [Olea europaea subsp. europaea]